MHFPSLALQALSLASLAIASPVPSTPSQAKNPEDEASQRLGAVNAQYYSTLLDTITSRHEGCHAGNIRWRQEW